MGSGSRPCLTECSCAVSQHVEAGGPRYELQNEIKDSEAKVALSFQPEDGIFIKWLFGDIFTLLLSISLGICKPRDLGRRTSIMLVYFLFIFPLFIMFPYS